ncbi:MAG: hypothetical protein D6713_03575 [Deltaproteobacteria bacterium]|nr:MAG: hypothetical protein D6713_03575 [Deltaproteobacteria bacterium]
MTGLSRGGSELPGEVRILLLPFCLSRQEMEDIEELASERGYSVVVARSTAYALSRVREETRKERDVPVRIVGVVCDGRAKKVALGLFLLKVRDFFKKLVGVKRRPVYLARVSINGGTPSMFGRRLCNVGRNTVPREDLLEALEGGKVFFRL